MKPNILFIIIDGLRHDKCYGETKTSLTPNLDSLLTSGVYFTQTISSSDGTRTCIGSIFTAQYPSQSGLSTFTNHKKSTRFFDLLKKSNYTLAATVPDVDLWQTLTKNFEFKNLIPKPYEYLFGGTGEKILNQLHILKNSQPWIYYIHIMDLHKSVNFEIPENFKDEKFGNNEYEKMISGIDFWIGKILEKINLEETLVILTSDHGDFIPVSTIEHEITYIPSLVKFGQKMKQITPKKLQPTGESIFVKIRDSIVPARKAFLKSKLSKEEMRTLNVRGSKLGWELFEEVVRVPLLFSGYGIKSPLIVKQQVRQIDIIPTIFSIIGLPQIVQNVDGQTLFGIFNGETVKEEPALIENQLLDPHDNDIGIGIRTSNYKYFRKLNDSKSKSYLYDLKNDPTEKQNINHKNPDIVDEMELLLKKYRTKQIISQIDENDEESLKIKEELKKMGYI